MRGARNPADGVGSRSHDGLGANERPSPFVRTYRQQVVIATKFGNVRDADGAMSISNDPGYLR